MKTKQILMAGVAIATLASASTAMALPASTTGPSTSQTPYILPSSANVTFYSILSAGDTVTNGKTGVAGGYTMAGIPDGMGAYDNNDGTFTLLMNHEIPSGNGAVRDHGANGAFVSKWTINKSTLAVLNGQDLMNTVVTADGVAHNAASGNGISLNRFCSADLPSESAFYNSATGLGTTAKIYMNGEESSTEGRAFAHVVTGANAGTSFELPYLGKMAFENAVANPGTGDKTVVVGTDDGTGGQVYVYIGDKTSTGSDIEKAGLSNGSLYAISVNGLPTETRDAGAAAPHGFNLVNMGDVSGKTGADLNTDTVAAGGTTFLRPEDAAWDPNNPNVLYFVTTDSYDQTINAEGPADANSRLWKATFDDKDDLTKGGTIEAVIDNSIGNMFDNITVGPDGHIILQEDIGGQKPAGKVWDYDTKTGLLSQLGIFDPARFGDCVTGGVDGDADPSTPNTASCTPAISPFSIDEESSGVIDVTDIFGDGWGHARFYLLDAQAHYRTGDPLTYEGGQLMLMRVEVPEPASLALFGFGVAGLMASRRRK